MDRPGQALTSLVLGSMPPAATPEHFLASGPWCFCGQEKSFPNWETRFTFAPEPLADPALLPVAARAAQTLCVRLIPQTAALLTTNPERLPDVYWQILLAPWLIDLASQLVERSLRCEAMLRAWANLSLRVPVLPPACTFAFKDEHDFTLRGSLGIGFNHWLFSRLFETAWPKAWQPVELKAPEPPEPPKAQTLASKFGSFCRSLLLRLLFPRLKGMSGSQALRFSAALRHPCHGADHSLDLEKAFNFEADLARIPLPADLAPFLQAAMPLSLKKLRHVPVKKGNGKAFLRIAALAAHEDAPYRQKLALWRAAGNRLAHVQHGGVYGQVETPCTAAITEYSQDIFFTWGWQTYGSTQGNFVPMPSLLLSAAKAWQKGQKLIFVGAEMPAYGRRLDSHPTPLQYVAYRAAKARFFGAVGKEILAFSLYRPYFKLPGTLSDADWLLPQFPGLGLCLGNLQEQIRRCRLLVLDHHGTTMLEAMAANIPMVLYWNRAYWPLSAAGNALLDKLACAGIWQPSPEMAAAQVRKVWNDPAAWWQSPEIQQVRNIYCESQARTSPNAPREWLKKLDSI